MLPNVILNISRYILSVITAVIVLILGFALGPEIFLKTIPIDDQIELIKLKNWLTLLVFMGVIVVAGKCCEL